MELEKTRAVITVTVSRVLFLTVSFVSVCELHHKYQKSQLKEEYTNIDAINSPISVIIGHRVSQLLFVHSWVVFSGDPKVPVLYQVDRTRDGRSFTVRSVKAIQHGKPILICQASFHMLQPSPLQHQFTMPVVPQPEDLLTVEQLIQLYLR